MSRARGIDVSGYQSSIDWSAVYAAGARFAGIKVSEGNTVTDKAFRAHRDGFRQQPFSLGIYYHFARSGNPEKQAERLMDTVGILRSNERLCCDFEVLPVPNHPADNLIWLDTFFATLMHGVCSDRRPIIYTSARVWRQLKDAAWDLASEIDLWAPRYNAQGKEPALPKPWEKVGWTFWQWTDGSFPEHITPGVGQCDADYFKGDDIALAAYAKLMA